MKVVPFSDEYFDAAARLLAARHRDQRAAVPLLDAVYEDEAACLAEVERLAVIEGSAGAVALDGGRAVGFLLGTPRSTTPWGPNMWVEVAGHAAEEPETVRDLYAACAGAWVDRGLTAHYVLVPAGDAGLVDTWFRLGFGAQHAHALRKPDAHLTPDPHVRTATVDDIEALASLDPLLQLHQQQAPVFSMLAPDSHDENVASWVEALADGDTATFVAEHDGRIVGSSHGCPVERSSAHSSLARPPRAGMLSWAVVEPTSRGTGLGRALGEAVLRWSAEQGHAAIVTDWRVTNLLSSRTWPALGFRPSFLRLHRLVG